MTQQLNESLKHLDMENQLLPIAGVDQYRSKIGDDSEFITVDFTTRSAEAAQDLVTWFERGYDWIIDAEESPGEVAPGKHLVFIELDRRQSAAKKIIDLIDDLETLTGLTSKDWQLKIEDKQMPATTDSIKDNITLSPHDHRGENEEELNEMRVIAGLEPHSSSYTLDDDIMAIQRQAGLR